MINLKFREGYTPSANCNGCGSGWNAKIVPNSIYGLNIREACCIHDDRYEYGTTADDKLEADKEFLFNILAIIDSHKVWYYPTKLARLRAMNYYSAVKDHGYSAFIDTKDK